MGSANVYTHSHTHSVRNNDTDTQWIGLAVEAYSHFRFISFLCSFHLNEAKMISPITFHPWQVKKIANFNQQQRKSAREMKKNKSPCVCLTSSFYLSHFSFLPPTQYSSGTSTFLLKYNYTVVNVHALMHWMVFIHTWSHMFLYGKKRNHLTCLYKFCKYNWA